MVGGEADGPADLVGEDDVLAGLHAEAHDARLIGGEAGAEGGSVQVEAVVEPVASGGVVAEGPSFCLGLGPEPVEGFLGIEGVVGPPGGEEPLDGRAVILRPLRLAVRAVRATLLGPFIRVEPAPREGLPDVVLGAFDVAILVGVLDPENEGTAGLPGEQVVVECRADASDVEGTGRAGRETDAGGGGHSGSGLAGSGLDWRERIGEDTGPPGPLLGGDINRGREGRLRRRPSAGEEDVWRSYRA